MQITTRGSTTGRRSSLDPARQECDELGSYAVAVLAHTDWTAVLIGAVIAAAGVTVAALERWRPRQPRGAEWSVVTRVGEPFLVRNDTRRSARAVHLDFGEYPNGLLRGERARDQVPPGDGLEVTVLFVAQHPAPKATLTWRSGFRRHHAVVSFPRPARNELTG